MHAVYSAVMTRAAKGHVEQLPSGSFRVSVYAGVDPLTRQQIRLRSTVKDERLAQIELAGFSRKPRMAARRRLMRP